jgi:ABC-type bacteriocin/lantibiotic exporter with double-glycine peptidase domain
VRTLALLLLCLCPAAVVCQQAGPVWIDVPFFKQPEEGCGAASLAMVMQYWQHQAGAQSRTLDVAEIQRALYSRPAHGIYNSNLERYLNQQGFRTYAFHGELGLLQQHLAKGRPLIVALKPASQSLLHYIVVAGIDPEQHVVLVNDPAQRKLLKLDSGKFEQQWQATGNWTLLAVPRS